MEFINFIVIVILLAGHQVATAVDPTPLADEGFKIKKAMEISSGVAQRCYLDYVNSVLSDKPSRSCTSIEEVKTRIQDIYKDFKSYDLISVKEVEDIVNILTFHLDAKKLKVFKYNRGLDVLWNSILHMVDCLKVIASKNETMTSFDPFIPIFNITYNVKFGEKSRHLQTIRLKSCFIEKLGPQTKPIVLDFINEQFDQIISISATYMPTYYVEQEQSQSSTGIIIGVLCGIVGAVLLVAAVSWFVKKRGAPVEGQS